MTTRSNRIGIFRGVDLWAVALYLLIVGFGFLNITSASSQDAVEPFFAFANFHTKQLMWMGASFVVALTVLLIDASMYHKWAYIAYGAGIALLLAVLLFGREVNGARAWFSFGSFRWQPVEVAKIATALAMARLMSEYHFSISEPSDLVKIALLLGLPLGIIVLQNDTGSGVVLCSFIFVLYREGLNKWLCIPLVMIAVLFLVSFLLTPWVLLVAVILVCALSSVMMDGNVRLHVTALAALAAATLLLYGAGWLLGIEWLTLYRTLLSVSIAAAVGVGFYAFRARLNNLLIIMALFLCSMVLLPNTQAIFDKLKPHQQNRILVYLGLKDDPVKFGYNVRQAQIAIGSGRLMGKGFMNGTQTQYGFVPEKHTDFIFCAAAEEWGFVGSMGLLLCYAALIFKLMRMGERQNESFGRIYCYCVAAILLFHVMVNIGMTVGLVPVMGIPLPFMSYGGSSLIAFTILLFIAVRMDASTRQFEM